MSTNNFELRNDYTTGHNTEHDITIYTLNNGEVCIDKNTVMELTGVQYANQIYVAAKTHKIHGRGYIPAAPGSDTPKAIFTLQSVLDWKEDYEPRGENDGTRRYQLKVTPENMAKVVKFLKDNSIDFDIEDLTKKQSAAAKAYHAKQKAAAKNGSKA